MHPIDLSIVAVYLLAMLGIGLWFLRRQTSRDEYFVGGRSMGTLHVGLSVVATDVGGGFSIGLGGLGFTMGLSGSWLLFTGLVGAWMAAVLLIPRIKPLGDRFGWLTYPDFLAHRYGGGLRLAAGLVSAVGYAAFVGAQLLAGAKLCAAAFDVSLTASVWIMAAVVVAYTAFGGLQAVVFTDTIQWIVLLAGLALLGLPFGLKAVGGWEGLYAALPRERFSLTNVEPTTLLTWALTIIPIWFIGNTLYQRIYACKSPRVARRAWYLAGLLEYPLMAFLGAALGMIASVLFPTAEPEMGLPLLLRSVLPVGVAGLVLAAYFSAIMSTADSCLLASVGNAIHDLYLRHIRPDASDRHVLWLSRGLTLGVGLASVGLALALPRVLDAILLAYSFMVCGLFVPTVAGLVWKAASSAGALASLLGGVAVVLLWQLAPALLSSVLVGEGTPPGRLLQGLAWLLEKGDPSWVALPLSVALLIAFSLLRPDDRAGQRETS